MSNFFPNAGRHIEVLKVAWKTHRESDKGLSPKARQKRDELKFLPAALEITETPAQPLGRAMMFVISALVAFAIIWSFLGKVEIIVTAQGEVGPAGATQVSTRFEIDALLMARDIDTVVTGQGVTLKVGPGGERLEGQVRKVSDTAIKTGQGENLYRILISIEPASVSANNLIENLKPGVPITAEIKTGERRIIDYVLKAPANTRKESAKE